MKLSELKTATKNFKLVDLDHAFQVGQLAYKMGMDVTVNPFKTVGQDAWVRGYTLARRDWEIFLKRNGAGGSKLLWMV
jgi:hypothetical protein